MKNVTFHEIQFRRGETPLRGPKTAQDEAKIVSRSPQDGLKTVLKCDRFLRRFFDRFLVVLGSVLASFWHPRWVQKPIQVGPVNRASAPVRRQLAPRPLQEPRRPPKSVPRPPQEPKTTPKTTKNDPKRPPRRPKMTPHDPQDDTKTRQDKIRKGHGQTRQDKTETSEEKRRQREDKDKDKAKTKTDNDTTKRRPDKDKT